LELPDDLRLSDLEPRGLSAKACGKRGADVRPDFNWSRAAGRDDGLSVIEAVKRLRAGLLALPAFLAIRYRYLAPRVAALKGGSHLSLAADVYARTNIAINGQCGRRKRDRQPVHEHCGQKRK
jgi:hypothetical protein